MTDQDQNFEGEDNDVKVDQIQMNGPWSEAVAKLPLHGCPCCTRPVLMETSGRVSVGTHEYECPECGARFEQTLPMARNYKLVEADEMEDRIGTSYKPTEWAMLTEQRRLAEGAQRAIEFVKENGGVPDATE